LYTYRSEKSNQEKTMAGVSSVKLFVGNLPFSATNNTLETFFSPFGELIGVKLVEDRSTHRPRGFGFVTFKESAAATTTTTTTVTKWTEVAAITHRSGVGFLL
jgi:RNA recognition motif-containing protein